MDDDDDDDELDREASRILAVSDDEILREAIAQGRDIELEIAEMTAVMELAILRAAAIQKRREPKP